MPIKLYTAHYIEISDSGDMLNGNGLKMDLKKKHFFLLKPLYRSESVVPDCTYKAV